MDYLLTAMTKVRSVDNKTSFLFFGNVNAYHEKWLGSSTITVHGKAALESASSSGYEQTVTEPRPING